MPEGEEKRSQFSLLEKKEESTRVPSRKTENPPAGEEKKRDLPIKAQKERTFFVRGPLSPIKAKKKFPTLLKNST